MKQTTLQKQEEVTTKEMESYILKHKPRLDYLNDDIFKMFINLEDNDSIAFTKLFIQLITGLHITDIQTQNIEFSRISESTKTSRVDFLAKVNDNEYVNIEIEKELSRKEILPKVQTYQSHMFLHATNKGEKRFQKHPIYSIVLYNGIYKEDELFISKYEYSCRNREVDRDNSLFLYLVELKKARTILEKKSITNMNDIEKLLFFIKYRNHPEYHGIIKKIKEMLKEVTEIMDKKYDMYTQNMATYMYLVKEELEAKHDNRLYYEELREDGRKAGIKEGIKEGRELGIAEGIKEGREEGREEGIELGKAQTIISLLEQKIGSSIPLQTKETIMNLSTASLQKLLENIFIIESFDDIKKYI